MSFLVSVLTGFKFLDRRTDDDMVDRLHYSLTTNLLIGLSILVSWKQFGGKPVECMPPDQYPSSWEQYVENYCWAQDTYHVPQDQELRLDHEEYRRRGRISYYKFVPFCLLFSALTFQLPFFLWKVLSHRSGLMLIHIIQQASDPKNVMKDVRETTTRIIASYIENAMRFKKRLHYKHRKFIQSYSATYVTFVYLFTKTAYLVNVLLNFFLMNHFLTMGHDHSSRGHLHWYGWQMLREVLNGTEWDLSGFFPRVTVCDFKARVVGFVQKHSVQCVLVINIFNEKIFLFLWFWYHFLMLISLLSLVYWAVMCLTPCCRRWFIVRHLEMASIPFEYAENRDSVDKFVFDYLKIDGLFLLRMINNHTGAIFTSDLIALLWDVCLKTERQLNRLQNAPALYPGRWPPLDDSQLLVGKDRSDLETLRYRTVPARPSEKRSRIDEAATQLIPPPGTPPPPARDSLEKIT